MSIFFFLLAFGLWAGLHTLLAAVGTKQAVNGRLNPRLYAGWYRLFYNGVALVTFLPVYRLVATMPQTVLWSWSRPYAFLALGIQIVGLVGLAASLWLTDIWHFLGIRQAIWYLRGSNGDTPPTPPFTTKGPYALVRHPLYFFSLLWLWFIPVMTVSSLVFYAAITLYFWLGAIYEEKKLAASFGADYHAYQQRVPRFLPFKRPSFH